MLKRKELIRTRLAAALRCIRHPLGACPLAACIAIAVTGLCLTTGSVDRRPITVAKSESAPQIAAPPCPPPAVQPPPQPRRPRPVRAKPEVPPHPKFANFAGEPRSDNAGRLADWIADSRDNRGMPFAVIDKAAAKVFVFDAFGRLRGSAPVLLGLARGDYSVPGIGGRGLSEIRPDERTTPAGRFVAYMGFNARRTDVLWVDYKNAVSLHRVITNNPEEHRLERLSTPGAADKRISYGCINVPADFFDRIVKPSFTKTYGIVYVLPESLAIQQVFGSYYDVQSRWGPATARVDGHTAPGAPVPASRVPPPQGQRS